MQLNVSLTVTNVSALLTELKQQIKKQSTLEINLAKIVQVDSAGIALLLELKAIAKRYGCNLYFSHTADVITRFCNLYTVTL